MATIRPMMAWLGGVAQSVWCVWDSSAVGVMQSTQGSRLPLHIWDMWAPGGWVAKAPDAQSKLPGDSHHLLVQTASMLVPDRLPVGW